MTNGEYLRQKADPGLALWLANRIDCIGCPVQRSCKGADDEKSCSQKICDWLESERKEGKADG